MVPVLCEITQDLSLVVAARVAYMQITVLVSKGEF